MILEGLEQLFQRDPRFQVVATSTNGEETLESAIRLVPDILVLDVRMPRRDGIEVLRELHEQDIRTRVVLLTASLEDDEVLEAIRLGVWGIILKEAASVQLMDAVLCVVHGEHSLDPRLVERAKKSRSQAAMALREVEQILSPREIDVVRMVARGLRNREIAAELSITVGTVKSYLHVIYEKLDVHGRVELTRYAWDRGLE